ncbi:MAG: hypothetical protein JHC22_06005 [Thermoproteus sp.]|nr:hypothetical protein [Thermoproteus sp.]
MDVAEEARRAPLEHQKILVEVLTAGPQNANAVVEHHSYARPPIAAVPDRWSRRLRGTLKRCLSLRV